MCFNIVDIDKLSLKQQLAYVRIRGKVRDTRECRRTNRRSTANNCVFTVIPRVTF